MGQGVEVTGGQSRDENDGQREKRFGGQRQVYRQRVGGAKGVVRRRDSGVWDSEGLRTL